jgi:hypothetical protein
MLSYWDRENLFVYHPPTAETQPKYDAIRAAEQRCLVFAHHLWNGTPTMGYEDVNRCCRAFAETIDLNAPDSADKSAAIRNVRLARNAMNEYIATKGTYVIPAGIPQELRLDTTHFLADTCMRELFQARFQACAAVALDAAKRAA